ncbi:TfoX/Sxy family protein [Morganella morganii]|nr:TfoX/Sxy family protein [Morganella morganii]
MGLSIDRVTFALIANSQLWLKSTEATRELFCRLELSDRFTYPKRILPMRINYYRVPDAVWQCPQQSEFLFTRPTCMHGNMHSHSSNCRRGLKICRMWTELWNAAYGRRGSARWMTSICWVPKRAF